MAESQQAQADLLIERESTQARIMGYREEKLKMKFCNDIIGLLGLSNLRQLFHHLDLSEAEIGKAEKRDDPDIIMSVINRRVLNDGFRRLYPERATIGVLIQGLEDAKLVATKEEFEKLWITKGKRKASDKYTDRDIDQLSEKVPPNDLTQLYYALELEQDEIELAKGDANRCNVEKKCMNVLNYFKKTYPAKATLGHILDALKEATNINDMEELEAKWKKEDADEPDLK